DGLLELPDPLVRRVTLAVVSLQRRLAGPAHGEVDVPGALGLERVEELPLLGAESGAQGAVTARHGIEGPTRGAKECEQGKVPSTRVACVEGASFWLSEPVATRRLSMFSCTSCPRENASIASESRPAAQYSAERLLRKVATSGWPSPSVFSKM